MATGKVRWAKERNEGQSNPLGLIQPGQRGSAYSEQTHFLVGMLVPVVTQVVNLKKAEGSF